MSLEFAKIFNYLHSKTPMHSIDPRAKFSMLLSFSILSFVYEDLSTMVLLFLFMLPFLFYAKIFVSWFKGLSGMSFLITFILIINSYTNSLNFALFIILRIIILMAIYSIFFQTTLPEDLTQALVSIGFSYQNAFSFSLAFRFVPTMAQETQIIIDAQRSRGHQIQEGGMIQQVRNMFPSLVPLIMNSVRRALNVAEALETRAFTNSLNPKFLYPIHFSLKDWGFTILNLLILVGGFVIYFNLDQLPTWVSWNLAL